MNTFVIFPLDVHLAIAKPVEVIPDDTAGKYDAYANTSDYLSSSTANGNVRIRINPNADRSMFAHELGHAAAQQTDIGQFIHRMRHNFALKRSLVNAALMTIPAGTLPHLTLG